MAAQSVGQKIWDSAKALGVHPGWGDPVGCQEQEIGYKRLTIHFAIYRKGWDDFYLESYAYLNEMAQRLLIISFHPNAPKSDSKFVKIQPNSGPIQGNHRAE